MCEQAARYCRAGVQRLLRKPPPALRGLDGLLRWVVARMSDKAVAERELLSPGAAAAAAAQRKGTSVILDVSVPRGRRRLLPPSLPARILHRLGSGVSPRGRRPPAGRARGCSPGAVPPWPGSRAHPSSSGWALFPGCCISRPGWARGCTPAPVSACPAPATAGCPARERTAVPAPSLPDPAPPERLGSSSRVTARILHPGPLGDGRGRSPGPAAPGLAGRKGQPLSRCCAPGLGGHGLAARVLHPLVRTLHLLNWLGTRGAARVLHPLALHTLGQLGITCTLVLHLLDRLRVGVQSGSCTPFPEPSVPKVLLGMRVQPGSRIVF